MNLDESEKFYEEISDLPLLVKRKNELLEIKSRNDIIFDKLKQKENFEREIKILEMKLEKLAELNAPISSENLDMILYFQEDSEFFNKKLEKYLKNAFSQSSLSEINGEKIGVHYCISINKILVQSAKFYDQVKLEEELEKFFKNLRNFKMIFSDEKNYFFIGECGNKNLPIRNIQNVNAVDFSDFFTGENLISEHIANFIYVKMKSDLLENFDFEKYRSENEFYFKNTPYYEENINGKINDIIMKHAVKYVREIKKLSYLQRSAKKNNIVKVISSEVFFLDNLFLKIEDAIFCKNKMKKKLSQCKIFERLLNLFSYESLKHFYLNYANILYLNEKKYFSSNTYQNLCNNLMNCYAEKLNFKNIFEKSEIEILDFIEKNYAQNLKFNNEFFYANTDIPCQFLDCLIENLIDFLKSTNISSEKQKYENVIFQINKSYIQNNKSSKNYKNFLSIIRIFTSSFEEIMDLLKEDGFFLKRSDVKMIVENIYKN